MGLLALGALLLVGWCVARAGLYDVEGLTREAPERTALMRQREREARRAGRRYRIDQRWVPYSRISPALRRAVLIAEDDAFFSHGGLDWNEIGAAARRNLERRRVVRGGSTITQQLAKNVFLGDARTITRKLTELFLAFRLERELPKRRIFELYLNLIEWGDGVFGAEAAAHRHFGVSAARLDERQAVLLASVIINPRRYSPADPNRRIQRRVRMIAARMRRRGDLDEVQYRRVLGEAPAPEPSFTDWLFGPPEPLVEPAPPEEVPAADTLPAGAASDSVPAP